ncbi:MAG: HEAT repeat domain-containing protein [Acidobacteriota bacterium]
MRMATRVVLIAALAISIVSSISGQRSGKPPLSAADIDAIATLLKLEDTRQFDEATLARLITSTHPEVKRRAIVSVGRIVNENGRALLASLHGETDAELLATVAFATGQLKDPAAVSWLSDVLNQPKTPVAAAREAAQALGKIRTPEAHAALAHYLLTAPTAPAAATIVGEALLSIGRFTTKDDLAPIARWTTARDVNVRWRAAWALFRPRDPAAVQPLLKMSADAAPDVRFWALRGLAPELVDQSGLSRADASARLRQAVNDPDRRVRTEAIRALVMYDDDASFEAVVNALASSDTWLSVSAAEKLDRFSTRAEVAVPALVAASAAGKPLSLRVSALTPLVSLSPDSARSLAAALGQDASVVAQQASAQAVRQLDAAAARAVQAASGQSGRSGGAPTAGRSGGSPRPALTARTDAAYRDLVTTWIVPDYNGAPRPHVVLNTRRGAVELELFPGDAPFGVDYLLKVIASGEIVNTEFGRVVPNFVAQQRAIRTDGTLRDEVNRRGLVRGTLSWASSGLDTGRPGYTLASTPQPHNEGDFTALGRVVNGLDVVDRIELGDRITGARKK